MKYRCIAFAAAPYGSGRASMRAFSCLYCFFCSSDPVRVSIHFATMSVLSFCVVVCDWGLELSDPFREEAPRPEELCELLAPLRVERIDLAGRPLFRRDFLHIDEPPLLYPDEQRVHGSLDEFGEALLSQPRGDLVAVRRLGGQDREDDALEGALEHLRHLIAHGRSPSPTLCRLLLVDGI